MTNRAIQTELLEQRIAENRASQEVDLVRWIFERIPVRESDQVLELCCGTGGQTLRMLSTLGERGRLHALDVSRDALSTLVERAAARQVQAGRRPGEPRRSFRHVTESGLERPSLRSDLLRVRPLLQQRCPKDARRSVLVVEKRRAHRRRRALWSE